MKTMQHVHDAAQAGSHTAERMVERLKHIAESPTGRQIAEAGLAVAHDIIDHHHPGLAESLFSTMIQVADRIDALERG